MVAQNPPIQWVANESPLSTHLIRLAVSVNLIFSAVLHTAVSSEYDTTSPSVPITPRIAAEVIPTKPAAGVMKTNPEIAPKLLLDRAGRRGVRDSQTRVKRHQPSLAVWI